MNDYQARNSHSLRIILSVCIYSMLITGCSYSSFRHHTFSGGKSDEFPHSYRTIDVTDHSSKFQLEVNSASSGIYGNGTTELVIPRFINDSHSSSKRTFSGATAEISLSPSSKILLDLKYEEQSESIIVTIHGICDNLENLFIHAKYLWSSGDRMEESVITFEGLDKCQLNGYSSIVPNG